MRDTKTAVERRAMIRAVHFGHFQVNESKTIAALRDFLSKGNGGRMLRVLESLDLKVRGRFPSIDRRSRNVLIARCALVSGIAVLAGVGQRAGEFFSAQRVANGECRR